MSKLMKQIISIALIFTMLAIPAPGASAYTSKMPVYEAGQNGKLTWKVQNNTLTISGKDAMTDFCVDGDTNSETYGIVTSAPWTDYRDTVTMIVIEDGVTSIGWYAFNAFSRLETIYIGMDVLNVKSHAFDGCTALKHVYWAQDKNSEEFQPITIAPENSCFTAYPGPEWEFGVRYGINIKYVLNGGKNNSANPSVYTAAMGSVTLKAPTRTGYTFAGWYRESTFKTRVTKLTSSNTGSGLTLYAKWTANAYTVRFSANGGTGTMKDLTCTYGTSKALTGNQFTRTNYIFTGWNTKKDGSGTGYTDGQKVSKLTSAKDGTVTLYAQWKRITYTIEFDGNGATSGGMKSITAKYGTSYTLTENAFKHTNFTFAGWNTKKDGSGQSYANKASVKNLTGTDGAVVTLYAKWKLNSGCYKIKYKLNSGKNNSANPDSYKKGSEVTLKDPTRTGYTFGGWYKDSEFKTKVTRIKSGTTGNITLYAKWTVNKYTVKFYANGGTGTMSTLSCTYGKRASLTANKFKRSGYTFAGWNTKKDGSGKAYADQASVKNLSSKSGAVISLYAQWRSNVTDKKDLENALAILRRIGEPANRWHNNNKVSYKSDNETGYRLWSCSTTPNGSLAYISAYGEKGTLLAQTYCKWNEPYFTVQTSHTTSEDDAYRASLVNGTYDFAKDPAGVLIGWSMFSSAETSKAELEGMINHSVSQEVFENLMLKAHAYATMQYGASCIIIYGRDSNGELIGKYAGSVYYSNVSNALEYHLMGINPKNTADYGVNLNGSLLYSE